MKTTFSVAACALLSTAVSATEQNLKWENNLMARQSNASAPGAVAAGGTTINGNNNDNGNTILTNSIVDSFNTGTINYYSIDPSSYYAKLCPTCPIVQVSKSNNTYAQQACPVCPIEYYRCPGYSMQSSSKAGNGTSAYCNYQAPICITCKNYNPAPPAPPMTTVKVSSAVVTVPVSAAASVQAAASASGVTYAQSVAAALAAATVTVQASAAAPSTVVNVPCSSCPAGSAATTVAQVYASPVPVSNVTAPAAPPPAAFKGTSSTVIASLVSVAMGLAVSLML